ncbi:hypothetical protein PRZ48_004039 [Zasmidium cellare]|uniref:Uncharacterized protein n=1 Tax=Zasmidium cellare TaxID=395010 RepID=A0ABR0EWR0_ZASCE|nr:hypothetical protein PRZ48_004039 [Zasmidium cellare]
MPPDDAASSDLAVVEYNVESAYTKFEASVGVQDDQLTTPLVFELQINPTEHLRSSDILLNGQPLELSWDTSEHNSSWTVLTPNQHFVSVPDKLGFPHDLRVTVSGVVSDVPDSLLSTFKSTSTQNININIDSVDGVATGSSNLIGFTILTDPTAPRRLLRLVPVRVPDTVNFDQIEESFMVAQPVHDVTPNEPVGYDDDESYDIEAEIESLLLLEAQAGELNTAIVAKKHAIAKCLKEHRDHVTLKHLLQQCDGLVCAAKVIAQRICDKMGILTVPKVGYAQVQDPHLQKLIDLDDENVRPYPSMKSGLGAEKYSNTTRMGSLSSAAIQPIQVVYPQSLLFRVLGGIAAALGLTALFAFIRRKCMSMRRRVERAADQEERRNARAYRRAARRAEMRRRWDAFVAAINCFKSPAEPPRIEDYEEKRALILQDAFLEQDIDAAEKGEVMEAEIRELRHAHQIVSSLVRVDEHRYDLITPINDPPPPMVPLPYTPATRSRASTATLPSYSSEALPDYSSRYTRTEAGSSSSSLRSNSVVIEGLDLRSPISSSAEGTFTGSTPRTHSVDSSTNGSRRSRYTPTSSVIETSPRPSEETLRTMWRRSRDTNDL